MYLNHAYFKEKAYLKLDISSNHTPDRGPTNQARSLFCTPSKVPMKPLQSAFLFFAPSYQLTIPIGIRCTVDILSQILSVDISTYWHVMSSLTKLNIVW